MNVQLCEDSPLGQGCAEVVDYEKGTGDLTISRAATRVVLVQVVLQRVPAPSDTHHHMSAKDLCGKKEKKMRPQWAADKMAKHSCMNETIGPQTNAPYTQTHTAQVHGHANSLKW